MELNYITRLLSPWTKVHAAPHKQVRASRVHWENFGVRCTGVAACFLVEDPLLTPGTPACDHLSGFAGCNPVCGYLSCAREPNLVPLGSVLFQMIPLVAP